jgi:hypothetical protein
MVEVSAPSNLKAEWPGTGIKLDKDSHAEVVAYLSGREVLRRKPKSRFHTERYTLISPHTCSRCSVSVIDGQTYGQVPMKGYALEVFHTLPYSLVEAVQASKAGCSLYEWLLELLVEYSKHSGDGAKLDELADAKFSLRFSNNQGTTAHPIIQIKTTAGENRELPTPPRINDTLVVSTVEGAHTYLIQSGGQESLFLIKYRKSGCEAYSYSTTRIRFGISNMSTLCPILFTGMCATASGVPTVTSHSHVSRLHSTRW